MKKYTYIEHKNQLPVIQFMKDISILKIYVTTLLKKKKKNPKIVSETKIEYYCIGRGKKKRKKRHFKY